MKLLIWIGTVWFLTEGTPHTVREEESTLVRLTMRNPGDPKDLREAVDFTWELSHVPKLPHANRRVEAFTANQVTSP